MILLINPNKELKAMVEVESSTMKRIKQLSLGSVGSIYKDDSGAGS